MPRLYLSLFLGFLSLAIFLLVISSQGGDAMAKRGTFVREGRPQNSGAGSGRAGVFAAMVRSKRGRSVMMATPRVAMGVRGSALSREEREGGPAAGMGHEEGIVRRRGVL
jgi:hypothetical protein